MGNFKKKILAGLLSGALILAGSQALAAPDDMPGNDMRQEEEASRADWAKFIAERYNVDSAQVEKALNDGVSIDDIKQAAVLAEISGKSFSEVLGMKVSWMQVAEKLGVTHEQIVEYYKQDRDEFFAKQSGVDVKTLQSLRKDGYHPHDIRIAAKIAKASNKNIKSVLEKRKINNTWDDVAKSFGVDMKKIMPPPHERR